MPDTQDPRPDETQSSDTGDETTRRYRYQWILAATSCCMLLDEGQDVTEVFCEQHEDVLLKHDNGQFSGCQIKTREGGLDPWKVRDKGVTGSLARFATLETQFPGQFRSFRFLTNHPLHRKGNSQDLAKVVAEVRRADEPGELEDRFRRVVARVAGAATCSEDLAFSALKKTTADDSLPKLDDAHSRLVHTLTQLSESAGAAPMARVRQAALALEAECMRASGLAHGDTLPAYLPFQDLPAQADVLERVKGKRFDKQRVLDVLSDALQRTAGLLADGGPVEPNAGTSAMLHRKLDAGGFSSISLYVADELRSAAEYLAFTWLSQFGEEAGLRRYEHVRRLVLIDAAAAFENTKQSEEPFGVAMLENLRDRFKGRVEGISEVYGATPEHLEGFVFGLTAQCPVAWTLEGDGDW